MPPVITAACTTTRYSRGQRVAGPRIVHVGQHGGVEPVRDAIPDKSTHVDHPCYRGSGKVRQYGRHRRSGGRDGPHDLDRVAGPVVLDNSVDALTLFGGEQLAVESAGAHK